MSSGRTLRWPIFGLALASLIAGAATAAPALPQGGQVASGAATISPSSVTALTIQQSSKDAIINWSSFSIGQGGSVTFDNGSGATLNRVTSGGPLSSIDGLLSATGSVYLINPSGVIVGKGGVVNVGGTFAASTQELTNAEFMAGGSLTFSGTSNAEVINYGKIGALGGDVALIASNVTNDGQIAAPNGDVGLAAGYQVVLRDGALNGGKFSIRVGGADTSATNAGLIQAADAELRANGGNVYALAGNTKSIIDATSVSQGGGKVFLVAEDGTLDLGGTIEAHGLNGSGGTIETSGSTVNIGQAVINAGPGGSWLLDPNDLTIDQTAANTIAASLDAGTNVTQQTTASGTGGNGDIFVNPGVTLDWMTDASLTLSAYRNVDIGAGSTFASSGGGAVTLYADNTGVGVGTVIFGAGSSVSTSGAVNLFYDPSVNPAGGGVNTTSYANPTENYAPNVTGSGKLTAYMLVNTCLPDLQNIQKQPDLGTYALVADVDASTSALESNGGGTFAGFVPIGGNGEADFTGIFEGDGHTALQPLHQRPEQRLDLDGRRGGYNTDGTVGLFGWIGSGGQIRDLTLTQANVTGQAMLVGAWSPGFDGRGPSITSSGTVGPGRTTGASRDGAGPLAEAGGVAGVVIAVARSRTPALSANVIGGAGAYVGGLVGGISSGGSIANAFATGDVSTGDGTSAGDSYVGGLIGVAYGSDGFLGRRSGPGSASPTPTPPGRSAAARLSGAGGFAGLIDNAPRSQARFSATGAVTQTGGFGGGFAGEIVSGSTVTDAYANGQVTLTAASATQK